MSQKPDDMSRDQVAEAPAVDCYPIHTAPDPYGFLCRWWAYRRAVPRRRFGLSPAGPHG